MKIEPMSRDVISRYSKGGKIFNSWWEEGLLNQLIGIFPDFVILK